MATATVSATAAGSQVEPEVEPTTPLLRREADGAADDAKN
jgi:hypothetical protein